MSSKVRATVKGLPELMKGLSDLEAKAVRKGIRKGINDATKLVLGRARAMVPTDTGSLKKSLGRKVKSYRSGRAVVGIIGPRKDAKGKPSKHRRVFSVGGRTVIRNPVKYAHLVEFGTISARARPFMRPAWDSTAAEAQKVIAAAVAEAIAKGK